MAVQMTVKLDSLSQERDAAVQKHQAMQADFSSRDQERESLTSTVSEAQKEAETLRVKHTELQAENMQLADTLRACTERHEALLEEHSKAGQESEAMFQEKQEIQKLMEEALAQLQETQAAKLEIEGKVKGSKQRSDNLSVGLSPSYVRIDGDSLLRLAFISALPEAMQEVIIGVSNKP